MRLKVGLISDTHGLIRQEAREILQGCGAIIHGGDFDNEGVLEELEKIAPVTAVRGNMDRGPWASSLKVIERVKMGSFAITVVHNIEDLGRAEKADLVIFGHSHRFLHTKKDGVTYINPGSAGPRRFTLPITMAVLTIDGEDLNLEKITLKDQL